MDGISETIHTHGNPNLCDLAGNPPPEGVNSSFPDCLFGATDPNRYNKREKMVHRQMASMCIAGFTNREIAKAFDYSEAGVSDILKQPYQQQWMLGQIKENAEDFRLEIAIRAKAAYVRIEKLAESAASESVRGDMNKYLVNRWLGMPTQPVETVGKPPEKKSDAELLSELNGVLSEKNRMPALEPTGEAGRDVGVGVSNESVGVANQ
jgi:FixJ family two-component response regulator